MTDTSLSEKITRGLEKQSESKKLETGDSESSASEADILEKAELHEQNIINLRHYRQLRKKYAEWVYLYLVGYSLAVFLLLLLDGFSCFGFSLPSTVTTALVGSTAAAAIGLVYAVTHGLFKESQIHSG